MAKNTSLPVGVGLDIGTSAVRCLIGMAETDSGQPSVIGFGEAPNKGVRRGTVADTEETVSAITTALDEATRIAGLNVNHASIGVNGPHLTSVTSRGVVAIGDANREINEDDVRRAEEAATVIQLPPNRETIQAFSRFFQLDGQDKIKNPLGMSGMRLEVESCLITAATPFLKNLTRSAQQAGLKVDNLVAGPLAAAQTLLTNQQQEQGSLILDIGVATTGLAVFEDGELLKVAVLPIGSGHITNDLAIGLRTDMVTAERVKRQHVDATPSLLAQRSDTKVKVKEAGGDFIIISKREINTIAAARLAELFDLVEQELAKIDRQGMLPGGVTLCGGGGKLRGLDQYAKQALHLPASLGLPSGFGGVAEKVLEPSYATALGLMCLSLNHFQEAPKFNWSEWTQPATNVFKQIINRLRN